MREVEYHRLLHQPDKGYERGGAIKPSHLALLRFHRLRVRTPDETSEHLLCLSFSRDVPCAPCYENQRIYIGKAVFFVTKASQESQRMEERNTRGVNRFGFLNRIRSYSDLDSNEV